MPHGQITVLTLLFGVGMAATCLLGGSEEATEPSSPRMVSLPEVISLALKNNFDIELARFDQKISRSALGTSLAVYDTLLTAGADYTSDGFKKTSQVFGELNKSATYSLGLAKKFPWGTELSLDFSNQYADSDSTFTTINPAYDASLQLSFSQPLLKNWGGKQTRGEVELVRVDADNFDLLAWESIEQSLALVARTYWDLVEVQSEVLLKQEMEERARYLYQLSQEQLKLGMIEQVDLLAAEANLKIKEADVILAQDRLTTISRLLQLLINAPDSALILPADTPKLPPGEVGDDFSGSLRVALVNRWDYLRALNELQAKKIELELNENSQWPQVDLVGSFGRNGLSGKWGEALNDIFDEDNPQYYLGVQFSHFLENRFAGSEAEVAELEKAKALVRIKKLEREIYTQVDEKLRTTKVSLGIARRDNEIQELQGEKLKAGEERFEYGRSDSKTIIDYQNDLLLAQLRTVRALTHYYKSLIDLEVVKGIFLRTQMGADLESGN